MGAAVSRQTFGIVLGLCGTLVAGLTEAQTLKTQLEATLGTQPASFLGYETVPHQPANATPEKYLVLDFRFAKPQPEQLLQASVHKICQAVLLNQSLVSTLSADGYNRLAVAFDRNYQYDCF
jgi:hypothetical protein